MGPELSISGRVYREKYRTIPSSFGQRTVSVPPLLKGHSITVQFMAKGDQESIWLCFGTHENVKSSPGIIAVLSKSEGYVAHIRSASQQNIMAYAGQYGSRQNAVLPRVVARYRQDVSSTTCFWMIWREGLLFVGCGNVGEGLLMAADISSDDASIGLDPKPEKNNRYVTDDVAAIFIGSGDPLNLLNPLKSELTPLNPLNTVSLLESPQETPLNTPSVSPSYSYHEDNNCYWDIVVRALWRNSPCRYARALTTCDSCLPEASPKDRIIKDKQLGRRSVSLVVPRLPSHVSLAELAWWLRFAFRPRQGPLAEKMFTKEDIIGHNIDIECIRTIGTYLDKAGNDMSSTEYYHASNHQEQTADKCLNHEDRRVLLQLRVTKEVLKCLLSCNHYIKDHLTSIAIVQE